MSWKNVDRCPERGLTPWAPEHPPDRFPTLGKSVLQLAVAAALAHPSSAQWEVAQTYIPVQSDPPPHSGNTPWEWCSLISESKA